MKRIKIYYVLRLVISALFGAAVGIGILWADSYAVEVFDVLLIALGVIVVAFNLPSFFLSLGAVIAKKKWEWISLLMSLVSIGFGACFMLILRTSPVLPTVLLTYVCVVPLARIILVAERLKQFWLELPKILFGLFLLVVTSTKTEDTMFLVLGIGVIVISALYLVKGILTMPLKCRPREEKIEE